MPWLNIRVASRRMAPPVPAAALSPPSPPLAVINTFSWMVISADAFNDITPPPAPEPLLLEEPPALPPIRDCRSLSPYVDASPEPCPPKAAPWPEVAV